MSSAEENRYGLVAPALPVEGLFEYKIPTNLKEKARVGKRVLVPFGNRKITGYLIEIYNSSRLEESRLKEIIDVLDPQPLFLREQMAFFRFCSEYYQAPLGEVLKTALPPGINVYSRKLVGITEEGRDYQGKLSLKAKRVLEIIEQFEELPKERISLLLDEPVSDALLNQLAKKGLIEILENIDPARVKPKKELEIKIKRHPSQEEELYLSRRAPEQYRLYLHLKMVGRAFLGELREQFKNPLNLVRALERRGLVKIEEKLIERKPFTLELLPYPEPEHLTPAQKKALEQIRKPILENKSEVFLLVGVTGSGKTEVYIQSAKLALSRGKSVLILIPEIALTPQLLHRFRSRFPEQKIAILHSGLSPAERFDQWWQIRRGEVSLVIGARSAIFSPLKNLGLIVVDEEQDSAYKQESGVRYNARDLAVWRGRNQTAVVILGSATPSLESTYNAQIGKYQILELPERIDSRPLPEIQVVDLKEELKASSSQSHQQEPQALQEIEPGLFFTTSLKQELVENFRRGNQSIIFLNRRGFAPVLVCGDCGFNFTCPNCSVSLTWHQNPTRQRISPLYGNLKSSPYLLCHYCGYHQPVPEYCPECLSVNLRQLGLGTEKIEQELKKLLPYARIARMDRDTMGNRRAYFELIQKMEFKEIDILVGTQMVAKGHDLPGVTLVGVLLAEQSLNFPDFRSGEKTFQLLTQVAGRAGRKDLLGRVIIQSFNPQHYAIEYAIKQDYWGFFKEELELRRKFNYPPFTRLALIRLSGFKTDQVEKASRQLARISRQLLRNKEFKGKLRTLGPAPCPIFRLRARVRFQFLIFSSRAGILGRFLQKSISKLKEEVPSSVKIELDRDPASLL